MKIAMIGAGYVGLTTGACLAELGHRVICVDVNEERIQRLAQGDIPIYEPGLSSVVERNALRHRLEFSADLAASVAGAEAVFLAVGTPSRPDGSIDLSHVEAAARAVAPHMPSGAVVVVKSTVVPGTTRRVRDIIAEARGGLDFSVASNPEFLREGSAVEDFMAPDRIVVGADDPRAKRTLEQIYATLIANGVAWVSTTSTNAEMIKYAANSLLALKVGFINDVADLCEAVGGDIRAVAEGIGLDRRIGASFLAAGPGFGGSCFPKDTRALAALGRQRNAPQPLIETLIARNEDRKAAIAQRILHQLGRPARGAHVAILGVSFKANTDDVRESAALTIVPLLQEAGCTVAAHDPQAKAEDLLPGVAWHDTPYETAAGADVVVILTEWPDYAQLDLARLSGAMRGSTIFDCRNMVESEAAAADGLRYVGLGRGRPAAHADRPVITGSSKASAEAVASPA